MVPDNWPLEKVREAESRAYGLVHEEEREAAESA